MRLIYSMKKKNFKNVSKFLERLGEHPEVCSQRLVGVKVLLPLEVVAYASGNEVLLVGLDASSPVRSELADEERFCNEVPLYFSESTLRASPVWKMEKVAEVFRDFSRVWFEGPHPVRLHTVLVSHHEFINAPEMEDVWESMEVQVLHRVKRMVSAERLPLNLHLSVCRPGAMSVFDERLQDCMNAFFRLEGLLNGGSLYREDDVEMQLNGLAEKEAEPEEETAEQVQPEELEESGEDAFDRLLDEFVKEQQAIGGGAEEAADDEEDADEDEDEDEGQKGWLPEIPAELRVQALPMLENADEVMAELLGCEEIRGQMTRLTALTRYNARLHELSPGTPQHQVSLHAIFQGAPGTGKTTVCQIYASLLKKAGALSRGHVVVAGRHTFVGDKWGDEERTVSQTLEAARGGVLMIDEAYMLCSSHPNDPGRLVLPLMMPLLADEKRRDIAVVLCGYKEPMQQLLDQNEGLRSRFTNVFDFPDFSLEQLLEIGHRRLAKYGYRLTRQAKACLAEKVETAYRKRDPKTWGNARMVANLLDEVYVNHALRCTERGLMERGDIFTITAADVRSVHLPETRDVRRIGF